MGRAGGRALRPPFAPMEALSVDEIPTGSGWLYEPKWDGFRCLVFRNRRKVVLQSKAGRPLTRYFPDLIEAALNLKAERFVLDGEIVVPQNGTFSFDDLLQRIHPAQSRVQKLAAETPALLIGFDFLADMAGGALTHLPLRERRRKLESFAHRYLKAKPRIRLSPATTRLSEAKGWLKDVGALLDGIIAKRCDLDYRSGERSGMQKIKNYRTADCVVGGFRSNKGQPAGRPPSPGPLGPARPLAPPGLPLAERGARQKGAHAEARETRRAAGVHRGRAWRSEPMVHRPLGAVAAAETEARGRGSLRP